MFAPSSARSWPDRRVFIAVTSSGFTFRRWAISAVCVELSAWLLVFMLRRLKNSLRCAFVVATLSIRQFFRTYS